MLLTKAFQILGLQMVGNYYPSIDEISAAYKKQTLGAHPDKPGGSTAAFLLLQQAKETIEDHYTYMNQKESDTDNKKRKWGTFNGNNNTSNNNNFNEKNSFGYDFFPGFQENSFPKEDELFTKEQLALLKNMEDNKLLESTPTLTKSYFRKNPWLINLFGHPQSIAYFCDHFPIRSHDNGPNSRSTDFAMRIYSIFLNIFYTTEVINFIIDFFNSKLMPFFITIEYILRGKLNENKKNFMEHLMKCHQSDLAVARLKTADAKISFVENNIILLISIQSFEIKFFDTDIHEALSKLDQLINLKINDTIPITIDF